MIITEDIFTCVREWRRNKLASAFISTNTTSNSNNTNNTNTSSSSTISTDEEMLVVLSGMNIVPGKLIISSLDKCTTAIEIHSRCCQISIPFLEEDRLRIVRQLRSRSILDSITGMTNNRMESSDENILSSQQTDKPCNLPIYDLLMKLHLPSCWWCIGDVVRLALKSPRLSFVDSTLIRHRCAAVILMDNHNSSRETNVNSLLKVNSGTIITTSSSAKLLLPRGSPVSFIRLSLLPSTLKWMRELEMESSCGLTSKTAMEILQALFGLKRTRSLEEENDEVHIDHNSNNNNEKRNSHKKDTGNGDSDLVPSLCLLFALFGYKIESVPLHHSSNHNNNNDSNNNNNNDSNEDDRWQRIGANVSCYFCGQKPKLVIQEVVVQSQAEEPEKEKEEKEKEKEEEATEEKSATALDEKNEEIEQNNENDIPTTVIAPEPKSPVKIQTPQFTSTTHYHYTIHLTEQNDDSGHHPNCPWRILFLRTILADCLSPAPSKELQFNLSNVGTRVDLLSVCLQRPEVTKLMECWRRSVYAVNLWGEVYTQHPLPAAVRTAIPPPADGRVEKYLQTLQSRYGGIDAVDNNSNNNNSNTNSGRMEWQPTQITPLFDRRCFWESYFRVVSVVKAAAATNTNTTNTNTNITSTKETQGDVEVSTSSKIMSNNVGHWKSVYDAGRRCIIAAAEGKDTTILTTASQKFKELYNRNLDQDKSTDSVSAPLSGVMSRLFHLLGDGLMSTIPHNYNNHQQCDDISAEEKSKHIQLSSQDAKRVQTFLAALDNIVEKASRDPPQAPQRLNKAKQPNTEFSQSNIDKNARQGGTASHTQPKQQQHHQQSHQHQHQHQQKQQKPKQQQQHQQQQKSHPSFPHHFPHIQTASSAEGILPFPPGGMNTGVLPVPGTMPFIQQQQQQSQQSQLQQQSQSQQQSQQQQNFRHGMHSPVFSNPGRGNVLSPEAVGVLNDGYMQRPSVMGQRPIQTGNFAADRKGGRGGNHRGGRGGRGGGGGGGRGRNAFK